MTPGNKGDSARVSMAARASDPSSGSDSGMRSATTVALSELGKGATLLTISGPASGNALSFDTIGRLLDAIRRVPQDRVIVIRGDAGVFCAGRDRSELENEALEMQANFNRAFYSLLDRVGEYGVPTLAAMNGAAFGCGLELALRCDLRLATASAVFRSDEEVPLGAVSRSPLLRTATPLSERLLAGREHISAAEALASGGLAEVFGDDDFDRRIGEVVDEISMTKPADLRRMKEVLRFAGQATAGGRRHRP